mmetsp:Transcript_362/g.1073  ORF Transcript_362/g.1073 Transcript_362/m.1073 type:complete len:208 (-) Transcript_362:436-1059(-)
MWALGTSCRRSESSRLQASEGSSPFRCFTPGSWQMGTALPSAHLATCARTWPSGLSSCSAQTDTERSASPRLVMTTCERPSCSSCSSRRTLFPSLATGVWALLPSSTSGRPRARRSSETSGSPSSSESEPSPLRPAVAPACSMLRSHSQSCRPATGAQMLLRVPAAPSEVDELAASHAAFAVGARPSRTRLMKRRLSDEDSEWTKGR